MARIISCILFDRNPEMFWGSLRHPGRDLQLNLLVQRLPRRELFQVAAAARKELFRAP